VITAEVRYGKVQQRLGKIAQNVQKRVEKAVTVEALNLVGYVKANKLSDQVLKVRTGRLRRSITAKFEGEGSGNFRAKVGTNVRYARAHEEGFSGSVQVPEHSRRQTVAWGKIMREPKVVTVRAHSMQMNIEARPFLRPSLTENLDRIKGNIRKALTEGLKS
jgi:phage gpG-like protein